MTKTANIHYNLTAWAATTTYSVGQRVSSTGNAYQCVQGGLSGSTAPNGTGTSYTDGFVIWRYLSAIDYTSLGAWQSDTTNYPLTLTQPYVVLLWNNTSIPAGTTPTITVTTTSGVPYFQLSGHTTSATNTITIKAAPGESFRDKLANQNVALAFNAANGVSFTTSGSPSANWFYFQDANIIIDGIQFKDPTSTSGSTLINFGGANTKFQNCIVDGYGQGSGANLMGSDSISGQLTVANCLIVDRQTNNAGITFAHQYSASSVANTTITAVVSTSGVIGLGNQRSSSTMTVKNCIIINYDASGSVYTSGTSASVDHSLFSCASLTTLNVSTGTGCLFSKTGAATFQSAYTDMRLLSTSSGVDAAAVDTTDIPTADDIARTPRPVGSAWDIGAWEYFPTPTVASYAPATEQPYRARTEMIPY